MEASLKAKWIAALRGGKYKQKAGALRGGIGNGETGHCCLGVLLDVVEPDGWQPLMINGCNVHNRSSTSNKHGTKNGYISASFAHKLGIPAGVQKRLARHNDKGDSFEVIADLVEEWV